MKIIWKSNLTSIKCYWTAVTPHLLMVLSMAASLLMGFNSRAEYWLQWLYGLQGLKCLLSGHWQEKFADFLPRWSQRSVFTTNMWFFFFIFVELASCLGAHSKQAKPSQDSHCVMKSLYFWLQKYLSFENIYYLNNPCLVICPHLHSKRHLVFSTFYYVGHFFFLSCLNRVT